MGTEYKGEGYNRIISTCPGSRSRDNVPRLSGIGAWVLKRLGLFCWFRNPALSLSAQDRAPSEANSGAYRGEERRKYSVLGTFDGGTAAVKNPCFWIKNVESSGAQTLERVPRSPE